MADMMEPAARRGGGMAPRIVTVTLNPAVDMACTAKAVVPAHKIRTADQRLDPGGGGINVAKVLNTFGNDAVAFIMTGGVTGRLIEKLLDDAGVRWLSVPVRGLTRICMTVHDRNCGEEFRLVPDGPTVTTEEWMEALGVLEEIEADWIIASGSLPPGVPTDFYALAAEIAARRGQRFVLDTSGAALRAAVGQGIDLLKLSCSELESVVGRSLADPAAQDAEVVALIRGGAARRVVVSLGADGAVMGSNGGVIRLPALPVREVSAVGAGDSFLAGLVLGLADGLSDADALSLAIAAGAAAVSRYGTAQVTRADVEALARARLGAADGG